MNKNRAYHKMVTRVFVEYRWFIYCTLFVVVGLLGTGCALSDHSDKNTNEKEAFSTSTLEDRKVSLEKKVAAAKSLKPKEVVISFWFRGAFVLHLDRKMRVESFEALNEDARILKMQTREGWKGKRYKKAVANVMEQAIRDGYISDNNPIIEFLVDQEVDAHTEVTDRVDIEALEDEVQKKIDEVISIHGITAEIIIREKE